MSCGSSRPLAQRELCVVESTLTPERSAWMCGLLLNEFEHVVQIAWFTMHSEYREAVGRILKNLAIASQGLCTGEHERQQIEQYLGKIHCGNLGSEEHWTLLDAENAAVDRSHSTDRESIDRHCEFLLAGLQEALAELESQLTTNLSESLLKLFTLARWVDRLTHPLPAYKVLTIAVPEEPTIPGSIWKARGEPREHWWLPDLPLLPQSQWTGHEEVVAQILVRQRDLEIEVVLPENGGQYVLNRVNLVSLGYAIDLPPAAPGTTHGEPVLVDVTASDPAPPATAVQPKLPIYLNLSMDMDTMHLCAVDTNRRVEVRGELKARLLAHFIGRGEKFTPRKYLETQWDALGGTAKRSTQIDNTLNSIRKLLGMLGFTLECQRRLGWRICRIA